MIFIPEHLTEELNAAEKAVNDYIVGLDLLGRKAWINEGKYKDRACEISAVTHHEHWKTKKLEVIIQVNVFKADGSGDFLNTYHSAYLRRYKSLDFVRFSPFKTKELK